MPRNALLIGIPVAMLFAALAAFLLWPDPVEPQAPPAEGAREASAPRTQADVAIPLVSKDYAPPLEDEAPLAPTLMEDVDALRSRLARAASRLFRASYRAADFKDPLPLMEIYFLIDGLESLSRELEPLDALARGGVAAFQEAKGRFDAAGAPQSSAGRSLEMVLAQGRILMEGFLK